jgi:hypothetical protein
MIEEAKQGVRDGALLKAAALKGSGQRRSIEVGSASARNLA